MISISDKDFDRAVTEALERIPPALRDRLDNVLVEVHARPSADLLEDYEAPEDLLGLYVGTPLEERGPAFEGTTLPDRVLIFKENLCAICDSREELLDEIRITVLHEIGHAFGLDEDELDAAGYG